MSIETHLYTIIIIMWLSYYYDNTENRIYTGCRTKNPQTNRKFGAVYLTVGIFAGYCSKLISTQFFKDSMSVITLNK